MKLIITKSQAECLLKSLSYAYNDEYPKSDESNAQILRINDKIENLIK